MPNRIVYQASTSDEVHQCAYSILKYLEVYNLKPPADHSVVVYTNDPASLELYGSFFSSFELKNETSQPVQEVLRKAAQGFEGNLLYLACNAYPVKPLDNFFTSVGNGTLYSSYSADQKSNGVPLALGFKTDRISLLPARIDGAHPGNFIAHYSDLKEFNTFLLYFFKRYQEESVPNQVKLIHHIDAVSIQKKRDAFNQLPFYIRWIRKAMGKGWSIGAHTQRV